MTFQVLLTEEADADLERLFDHVLERELASESGDPTVAQRARDAVNAGFQILRTAPFICRKAGTSPFLRELVIDFGHSGYVALFEIVDAVTVIVSAVRHQREDDYR